MRWIALALLPLCLACGVWPQPKSANIVAAFDVPLPDREQRAEFLALLSAAAEAEGLHLDAATPEDLERLSGVSPTTISATVWRGTDDDEPVALVLNPPDSLGTARISFLKGDDLGLAARFRERVMRQILARWPSTTSLPVPPAHPA
jgi:hypothetical protein